MEKQKLARRLLIYTIGLILIAFGSAFNINSDLGVSPIVSLPLVVSEIVGISIGMATTGVFISLILLQVLVLRKKFKLYYLTQILFSTMFGYFTNFAIFILSGFQLPTYIGRLTMMGVGFTLISLGIVFYMEAKVVPLPVEGLAEALTIVTEGKFHVFKMVVDSSFVVLAVILSMMFLGGIVGIREGTIVGMILVGKLIPPLKKLAAPLLHSIQTF